MDRFSDYMVQHILYVSGVEKSLRNNQAFAHKQPTECAFGKMFYGMLKPNLDHYSATKRNLVEQLEEIHIRFHESAQNIHPDNPDMEQHRRDAWYHSSRLINLLTKLEKVRD